MDNNRGMDMKKLRELYEKELEGEGTVSVGISVGNAFTHPSHPGGETGNAGFGPSVQNKGKAGGAFWLCPACKTVNSGKVCTVCGGNRPETEDEKREREQREAEERERRKREAEERERQKREAEERERRKREEREKKDREEREKKEREAERLKEEERNQRRSKGKKTLILSICAAAVLLVLFFAIRGGIQKNAAAKLSQEPDQLQTPVPSQEPAQPESSAPTQAPASEPGMRSITQNFDEDVAVTATLNSSDTESRLVIELIYRDSGIPFSEYRISVDDEGRVSRIEHDVDGERKTTRWLVYDSGLLSSYVIEMNDESIGGLAGDSIVLSNTEGELWLWGGPGAPEGFDATEWEDLDWGNTVIMDSFDMYTLNLYSPASFPQTGFSDVFVGMAYFDSDGVLSELGLFDFTYSDTITIHIYDSSLQYYETAQLDETREEWVSFYDDDLASSAEAGETAAQTASLPEEWYRADKYFTVNGTDQAIFLDHDGRTERLLLRSLSNGQLCADYRFLWDGDQLQGIERLDCEGKTIIRHVFSYDEYDELYLDEITADGLVQYTDYSPETQSWTAWSDVMPDHNGVKTISTDIGDRESRNIYLDSADGVSIENLLINREGNSFHLSLLDDSGNSILYITFHLGTLSGLKGGTLSQYAYTVSELDTDRNQWMHTCYDENWNMVR